MDEDVIVFAGKIFDLATAGDAAAIAAYVDTGVPVDLTNHRGDTLLMQVRDRGCPRAPGRRGRSAGRPAERGQRRADARQAGILAWFSESGT